MKLLDFKELKEEIKVRLAILKSAVIYSFHEDTAFVAQNWSNMASTFFYTLSFILFIRVMYTNVDTFAGYTENETLLLMLVGQVSFYISWLIFYINLNEIGRLVNKGDLDMLLTKPVPADFYITFKRLSTIAVIRDGLVPMLTVVMVIDWSKLDFTFESMSLGILIWLLGIIADYFVNFIVRLPVFWFGKGSSPIELLIEVSNHVRGEIPFEGLNRQLKILFGIIIPVAIDVGISTSVILQKSDGYRMLLLAFGVVIIFAVIKNVLWHAALKNYTSASS
jgi:ABC-type uncharacterized transport system permease subunit